MTSLTRDRLTSLLPALYRLRDEQQGERLQPLLEIVAGQLAALEENLAQLYDDQFIETCADWVAPYIGDLIGYRTLHGVTPLIASPRAEVANTIAYRRRKGTALMLEQLASDVTGWPAHAVEFFQQLVTTQYMKHVRPQALATTDMRDIRGLLQQSGPFNSLAQTAEMRRPERGAGRYNIPNIGIFLWRLVAIRLTEIPLTPDPGDASGRKFRLNPLGADLPLFRRAQTENDISHLAEPTNIPEPLSVRLMALAVRAAQVSVPPAPAPDARIDDDYGIGESLVFYRPGAPPTPVSVTQIRVCDLRDILDGGGNVVGWNHEAAVPAGAIGVDPARGRVLLGAPADGPLLATFYYGMIREFGGGEYERTPEGAKLVIQRGVSGGAALQPDLNAIAGEGQLLIDDSLTYNETPTFKVTGVTAPGAPGLEVVVAARNPARPLIVAGGDMTLDIGARGRLVLDGLTIAGGALHLEAAADVEPREIVLRDCTLVPGLTLRPDGGATSPGAPSLIVEHPFATVTLDRCITGPLRVISDATVMLQDCIVDAGATDGIAYVGLNNGSPGAELRVTDSTIVGKVHSRLIRLASNTIFAARSGPVAGWPWDAPLIAERRQDGCIRFSYIPVGSITPRCYHCVPNVEHPDAMPWFTSLRYGDPGYGQLRAATDASIRQGAADEGEMGVLHALFQPQRETNLRIRLEEYLRFGLHAGVFYAT